MLQNSRSDTIKRRFYVNTKWLTTGCVNSIQFYFGGSTSNFSSQSFFVQTKQMKVLNNGNNRTIETFLPLSFQVQYCSIGEQR